MSVYVQPFQLADAATIVCIEHDVEVPENHLSLCGFKTRVYVTHKCSGSSCCNRFLECRFKEKAYRIYSTKCTYFTVLSLQLGHPQHSTAY